MNRSKEVNYKVGLVEGVLESLCVCPVDEFHGRVAFLILHPCAVLHVIDTVLHMYVHIHQTHGEGREVGGGY